MSSILNCLSYTHAGEIQIPIYQQYFLTNTRNILLKIQSKNGKKLICRKTTRLHLLEIMRFKYQDFSKNFFNTFPIIILKLHTNFIYYMYYRYYTLKKNVSYSCSLITHYLVYKLKQNINNFSIMYCFNFNTLRAEYKQNNK